MNSRGASVVAKQKMHLAFGRRLGGGTQWRRAMCALIGALAVMVVIPTGAARAMSMLSGEDTSDFPVHIVVEAEFEGKPIRFERTTYCEAMFPGMSRTPTWFPYMRNFGVQLNEHQGVIISVGGVCDPDRPSGFRELRSPRWAAVNNICDIKSAELPLKGRFGELFLTNIPDNKFVVHRIFYTYEFQTNAKYDKQNTNIPVIGVSNPKTIGASGLVETLFKNISGVAVPEAYWHKCTTLRDIVTDGGGDKYGLIDRMAGRYPDRLEHVCGTDPDIVFEFHESELLRQFSLNYVGDYTWNFGQLNFSRDVHVNVRETKRAAQVLANIKAFFGLGERPQPRIEVVSGGGPLKIVFPDGSTASTSASYVSTPYLNGRYWYNSRSRNFFILLKPHTFILQVKKPNCRVTEN
jgi:hypothetical protein